MTDADYIAAAKAKHAEGCGCGGYHYSDVSAEGVDFTVARTNRPDYAQAVEDLRAAHFVGDGCNPPHDTHPNTSTWWGGYRQGFAAGYATARDELADRIEAMYGTKRTARDVSYSEGWDDALDLAEQIVRGEP